MSKKEILVVGEVSYKVLTSLNGISSKFTARKSTIGAENIVEALEGYPPDIIVAFVSNLDNGHLARIKKTFDRLNYINIPIICVGTAGECNIIASMFGEYTVYTMPLPLSIGKLSALVSKILESQIQRECIEVEKKEVTHDYSDYSDYGKKSILVVDDDVKILRLISAYLEDDYKVAVVNSGAAAIAYLGKNKPDAILLDYLMPICNGKQTLQMIRDLKGMENIPVIFLTGVSDRDTVQECLKLNPQGYILKPVAKDKLLDKLNKVFII